MDVYEKLKELGLTLPEAPAKGGVYTPCKLTEDGYAYISGCGPVIGGVQVTGKLGQDVSVEDGQKYAQNCMLNVLAVLERKIGDLNRVAHIPAPPPVCLLDFENSLDLDRNIAG